MKVLKGWRKISNDRGYLNETTGQTLTVAKKEFGIHYNVLLFDGDRKKDPEGKIISPDYPSQTKAEAFALDWMKKNPNGTSKTSDN